MPIGLTAKIEPKNNGFTGLVGADQVIGASGAGGYLPSSTISGNSIQEYQLKISNSPSDTYYLQYKDSTDKLTWAEVSANDVAWSGASGYIGHSSNVDIHFASSNILNWLDGEYQQSGTQGGISSWYDLDTGAGVTPFGGSVSVSGTQAESISILGYDTISSNAKKGQASGALALYDETYSSEGDLTSVLNDNYAGSSNINITLLNTISSNLDTKIDGKEDSLDGYEYYPSTMGNSLSGSYHIHSVDSSIHFTKVSIDDDYAGSGAFQTHKDDLTIHNISGTTALDWLNSSGTKYTQAYVSASTGVFALATAIPTNYLTNDADDTMNGVLTTNGFTATAGISANRVYSNTFIGNVPMTYSLANIRLSSNQNLNMARFKCQAGKSAYIYQANCCGSGGAGIDDLYVEMLAGATTTLTGADTVYKTSGTELQQGNPLGASDAADYIEIRMMYSGSAAVTGIKYGTAMMQVGVY